MYISRPQTLPFSSLWKTERQVSCQPALPNSLSLKPLPPWNKNRVPLSQAPNRHLSKALWSSQKKLRSDIQGPEFLSCCCEPAVCPWEDDLSLFAFLQCNFWVCFDWRLFRRRALTMIQRLVIWSLQAGLTSCSLVLEKKRKTLCWSLWISGATLLPTDCPLPHFYLFWIVLSLEILALICRIWIVNRMCCFSLIIMGANCFT